MTYLVQGSQASNISGNLPSIWLSEVTVYNTLGMWYSIRADADRRGIRPSMDTSTYQHLDVGYGHSPQYSKAQGVQHCFITTGQRRHVNCNKIAISGANFQRTAIFSMISLSPPAPINHQAECISKHYILPHIFCS